MSTVAPAPTATPPVALSHPLRWAAAVDAPPRWTAPTTPSSTCSAPGDRAELVARLFHVYCECGDRHCRDQLLDLHQGLAHAAAVRYCGRGEPYDDLVQIATLGLLRAIERFDPNRGFAFSTFAMPTITGELKRHFRDKGWMIRAPRGLQERRQEVKRVANVLTHELSRAPTMTEIAERTGFRREHVADAFAAGTAYRADSLDAPLRQSDEVPLVDRVIETDRALDAFLDRAEVVGLLRLLAPRDLRIITLRFFEGLTQDQIAAQVGLSQMQVSRLLGRSLARLRDAAATAHGR